MDWKNKVSSICGLITILSGALATAIQTGVLTFLPTWVSGVCVLLGVVSTGVIGWLTGKNPDLTNKTINQLDLTEKSK